MMVRPSHHLLIVLGVVAITVTGRGPVARPQAQVAGRGAIQTPGGGRGPGAAPAADDPANANADWSPKPPVLPLPPAEQARRFWLPAGYHLEPILSDPVIEDPA